VLAVEIHQSSSGSSDIVFGLSLEATIATTDHEDHESVILQPGEYALLVGNPEAFESYYGTGLNVIGQYVGFLGNGGEKIKLEDNTNSTTVQPCRQNKIMTV